MEKKKKQQKKTIALLNRFAVDGDIGRWWKRENTQIAATFK